MAGQYEIRCRRHRLWGYYTWDQFQRHQREHAQEEALRIGFARTRQPGRGLPAQQRRQDRPRKTCRRARGQQPHTRRARGLQRKPRSDCKSKKQNGNNVILT